MTQWTPRHLNRRTSPVDWLTPATSGDWTVRQFTVGKHLAPVPAPWSRASDFLFRRAARDPRYIPDGQYWGLFRGADLLTADTPDEVEALALLKRHARGHCLVAGMWLGLAVHNMLLRLSRVLSVTVIDKNPFLLETCGGALVNRFPGRLTLIEGDIETWRVPKGPSGWFDFVYLDVWESFPPSKAHLLHLKMRYCKVSAYILGWREDDLDMTAYSCSQSRRRKKTPTRKPTKFIHWGARYGCTRNCASRRYPNAQTR